MDIPFSQQRRTQGSVQVTPPTWSSVSCVAMGVQKIRFFLSVRVLMAFAAVTISRQTDGLLSNVHKTGAEGDGSMTLESNRRRD